LTRRALAISDLCIPPLNGIGAVLVWSIQTRVPFSSNAARGLSAERVTIRALPAEMSYSKNCLFLGKRSRQLSLARNGCGVLPFVMALRAVKVDGAPIVALHTAYRDTADRLRTPGAKPVPIVFGQRQRFHWSSGKRPQSAGHFSYTQFTGSGVEPSGFAPGRVKTQIRVGSKNQRSPNNFCRSHCCPYPADHVCACSESPRSTLTSQTNRETMRRRA